MTASRGADWSKQVFVLRLLMMLMVGAALSAAGPDPWTAAMGKALDEVGSQWGIQLS